MLGVYDVFLVGGFLAVCGVLIRGGALWAVVCALVLAGALWVGWRAGAPVAVLSALAVWVGFAVGGVVLWRRWRGRGGAWGIAVIVAAAEVATVAVIGTGAVLAARDGEAAVVRRAAAYPAVAAAGQRLAAVAPGDAVVQYPAPLAPPVPEVQRPAAAVVRPIDWAEVTVYDDRQRRSLTGTVVAADRAALSFEVDGTVARVNVEIGTQFSRGDVLAELDPTLLQITLEERRAALIEAEANARETAVVLERQRRLRDSGTVSEAAFDSALSAAESAQSRLGIARAGIRQAEDRLADAVLRAPYNGEVAARLIEPAQTVQPGQPAFEIQDLEAGFQVEITVPETLIARVAAGSKHRAEVLDGSDGELRVRVADIGSRANAATGFPVTLDVAGTPEGLRAGMTVEVTLLLPRSGAAGPMHLAAAGRALVAVPYTAILPDTGQDHVAFVYDPGPGTLERRAITVAGREGTQALISAGLRPGEVVATRGLPFLDHGQPVALRGVGVARYDD